MKKIIPVIVVVAILGIGAYSYLTGGKVQFTGNGLSVTKSFTSKSETFTGDLKAAIAKGTPFTCTFKTNQGTEGKGYMKNKQYYGDVNVDGKSGSILMLGNCMWTWDKAVKQGVKMCFEGDIWDSQATGSDYKSTGEYTCTSDYAMSDDMFKVPSNITFTDIDNPMGTDE